MQQNVIKTSYSKQRQYLATMHLNDSYNKQFVRFCEFGITHYVTLITKTLHHIQRHST